MTDWIEQYSAALDERDAREQAHKSYIDAFSKLADRTASSHTIRPPSASSLPTATHPGSSPASTSKSKPTTTESPQPSNEILTSLRTDLSNTQKARSALQTQVDELTSNLKTLELQQKTSTTQITQLNRQKVETERKLKDREEEIRGKSRLVHEAQDEMVALELQLHLAEEKAEKLKVDNKELLDRWMKAKREEAERMNRDSKWE